MFSDLIHLNVESVSGMAGAMLLVAFGLFAFLVVYRIAPQVYQALSSTKAQDLKTLRQAVSEERELFCNKITEVVVAWERQAAAQRETCERNLKSWERELGAQREMFKELFLNKNKP